MTDHEIHVSIDNKNKEMVGVMSQMIHTYTESITTLITTENQNIKHSIDQLTERVGRQNGRVDKAETRLKDMEEWKGTHIGIDAGKKDKEDRDILAQNLKMTETRDFWYKVFSILGIAIAIYFGVRNSKQTDRVMIAQEKQGVPFVINKRGEVVTLPDSTVIRWLSNDSISYLITRNKEID